MSAIGEPRAEQDGAAAAVTCVGDLPLFPCRVSGETQGEAVDRMLREMPDLPGVIVVDDGTLLGVISRGDFTARLSQPYGTELYLTRPIRALLPHVPSHPLVVAATDSLEHVGHLALRRPAQERDQPIVVAGSDGSVALLDAEVLLAALCRSLEAGNRTKARLLDEVGRKKAELEAALDELQRTQDRLVKARQLAELANVVAGVAHEVNTPLGIAVTAASHLAERTAGVRAAFTAGTLKRSELAAFLDAASEGAELILGNLRRAADLVQGFKQMAADETSDARRRFNLAAYLRSIVLSLRPHLKRTPHTVAIDCPEDLELDSYPGAVAQIVTNLLLNALRHAFQPDIAGHMRITVVPEDGWLELRLSDDGCGIAPDHLPQIFDRFFTTRRNAGGTGLGLYIVRTLVIGKLGGDVRCESAVGKGTTFIIRIPRNVDQAPARPPANGAEKPERNPDER